MSETPREAVLRRTDEIVALCGEAAELLDELMVVGDRLLRRMEGLSSSFDAMHAAVQEVSKPGSPDHTR